MPPPASHKGRPGVSLGSPASGRLQDDADGIRNKKHVSPYHLEAAGFRHKQITGRGNHVMKTLSSWPNALFQKGKDGEHPSNTNFVERFLADD